MVPRCNSPYTYDNDQPGHTDGTQLSSIVIISQTFDHYYYDFRRSKSEKVVQDMEERCDEAHSRMAKFRTLITSQYLFHAYTSIRICPSILVHFHASLWVKSECGNEREL